MAKHRLLNCDFILAGSFKVNVSNKGKLLYMMMCMSADDRGFVDTTNDLINALTQNEKEFDNTVSLDLLENTYESALNELISKGYLYEFSDNHHNKVHLIRHFFFHNKLIKGLWTNYKKFLNEVELVENEYVMKTHLKESNTNQIKTNQIKTNESNPLDELTEDERERTEPKYNSLADFLREKGVKSYDDLTEEQKKEWHDFIDSLDDIDLELPF